MPVCSLPEATSGYELSQCVFDQSLISEGECSLSCAEGYKKITLNTIVQATCSSSGGVFQFSGCEEIEDQTLPNDLRPGLRAHWTANAGIEVDANQRVLRWESIPNENGDVFSLTGEGNVTFVESQRNMGDNSVLNFSGGNLKNDQFDGMVSKNQFSKSDGSKDECILKWNGTQYRLYWGCHFSVQ